MSYTPGECMTPECPVQVTTDCVYYVGKYLPNMDVYPNDPLTTIIEKFEASFTSTLLNPYIPGTNYKGGAVVYHNSQLLTANNDITDAPDTINYNDWTVIVNEDLVGTTAKRQALVVFPSLGRFYWDTDLDMPLYYKAPNWYNTAGGITL